MTQRSRFLPFPAARPHLARFGRSAFVSAVVVAAAVGCSSDKSTGPSGSVVGTYNLASTNGPAGTDNSAPFVLFDGSVGADTYRIQIPSGTVTLGSDNHFAGTGTVDVYVNDVLQPDAGGNSFPSSGTYSVSGSTVTLTPTDGSAAVTATFSGGNTLTFTKSVFPFGTFTLVAKKQ